MVKQNRRSSELLSFFFEMKCCFVVFPSIRLFSKILKRSCNEGESQLVLSVGDSLTGFKGNRKCAGVKCWALVPDPFPSRYGYQASSSAAGETRIRATLGKRKSVPLINERYF